MPNFANYTIILLCNKTLFKPSNDPEIRLVLIKKRQLWNWYFLLMTSKLG